MGAASDDKKIMINLPMLRFLRTNDERAFIVAHEWSHQLLGHHSAGFSQSNYSTNVEIQADCVAAALTTRAGFNPHAGADILRRTSASAYQDTLVRAGRIDSAAYAFTAIPSASITRETVRRVCGVAP